MARHYEIEKEIKELLKECNIPLEQVKVGTGDSYDKKKSQFIYQTDWTKQRNAKYAVKYFDEYKIYLIWEVKRSVDGKRNSKRSDFSANAQAVINIIGKNTYIKKHVERSNGNEEFVFVFDKTAFERFVRETMAKEMENL